MNAERSKLVAEGSGAEEGENPAQLALVKVLVADAQRLFAEAIGIALGTISDFDVVPEYPTDGNHALDVVARHDPHVIVVDYWLPGMSGAALTRALLQRAGTPKVLLVSWLHGGQHVQEALVAGAVGFLPKSLSFEQLVEAIRRASRGEGLVFAEEVASFVKGIGQRAEEFEAGAQKLATLTPREAEVLQLLGQGLAPKEIGSRLSITLGTVKNHIHKILTKTGARSQLEAILIGRWHRVIGDVGPPPSRPRPASLLGSAISHAEERGRIDR